MKQSLNNLKMNTASSGTSLPSLKNIGDLTGKRVLLRIGVNVPLENGKVKNDFRIQRILPTIKFLLKKNAHIILLSHHSELGQSLKPVADYLKEYFPLRFVSDIYDKEEMTFKPDEKILFCENLRIQKGEEGNDLAFAKHLASLGDIYINDAFSVSHREHASIVLLPKLMEDSRAGLLFEEEIERLSKLFSPPHPLLFILGGAKISTKIPIAEEFIDVADTIFIGGALSNNFYKEAGYEIGTSLYDETVTDLSKLRESKKIILPIDVIVKNDEGVFVKTPSEVEEGDKIQDAGPQTIAHLKNKIDEAKFVLLNGPIGEYTIKGFDKGTLEIIEHIGKSGVAAISGGGDTASLIYGAHMEDNFDFISTGGGAMLEFLVSRTLPGIEALK